MRTVTISLQSSLQPAIRIHCPSRQGCKFMAIGIGNWHFWLLQGVPEERVSAEIATVLQRTALPLEMAGRPAGQYSGGSKRKLALGIALVGGSSTILLDEPSSGMVRRPSTNQNPQRLRVSEDE